MTNKMTNLCNDTKTTYSLSIQSMTLSKINCLVIMNLMKNKNLQMTKVRWNTLHLTEQRKNIKK
jgi:hypothetical protein